MWPKAVDVVNGLVSHKAHVVGPANAIALALPTVSGADKANGWQAEGLPTLC